MSYYSGLIQEIKRQVIVNNYPPVFEERIFSFTTRNCYAYALDLNVNDPKRRVFYPGCISSEKEELDIYNESDLLERLKKDLTFLGFSFRSNDKNLKENEYRIAIYAFPSIYDMPIGFHIARQDKDGYWSEKPNWNLKPRKLNYCGIEPPELINAEPFKKDVLIIKKN